MLEKLAEQLPEAKYPWHPAPDPKSDPGNFTELVWYFTVNLDFNGGFWGPYQENDLPGNETEVTDEDYDTLYEDDEEPPFDE